MYSLAIAVTGWTGVISFCTAVMGINEQDILAHTMAFCHNRHPDIEVKVLWFSMANGY